MVAFSQAATTLLVWGVVAHLAADWLTQNEWIALHKQGRRTEASPWWDRHPSLYVHGAAHILVLALVFPLPVAVAIGLVHMAIDTKEPVIGWSRLIHQTTPDKTPVPPQYLSIGQAVTIAADQVWHIAVIAVAAFIVG
jgi:uncharacterized protein DUF3307